MQLEGKTAFVFGVANKRSIAWAITEALAGAGARIALAYQDRFADSAQELAGTLPGAVTVPCDVADDGQIEAAFARVAEAFDGRLDILVHSIAFAPREALDGLFVDTSREAFTTALDVSAYSLVALARAARPLMVKAGGGSIVAMTYYGSEKVVPHYNVMGVAKAALEASVRYLAYDLGPDGIRVNAISAGPLNTLAARGIAGFTDMRKLHADRAPLKRNIEPREVGDTALFLCGQAGSGITGEVLYVDAGYNIMGM